MRVATRVARLTVGLFGLAGCAQRVHSPDEKFLAIAHADTLSVLTEASGRTVRIADVGVTNVGWSHRSDRIAFRGRDGRLGVIARTGGPIRWGRVASAFAWSPNDSLIAAIGPLARSIVVLDSRTLGRRREISVREKITDLDWSRFGAQLCARTDRSLIFFNDERVIRADCGGKILAMNDFDRHRMRVVVENSALESDEPRASIIEVDRFTGRKLVLRDDLYPRALSHGLNDSRFIQTIGFSPSGRYLALVSVSDATEDGVLTKFLAESDPLPGESQTLFNALKVRLQLCVFDVARPHSRARRVDLGTVSASRLLYDGGSVYWMSSRDLLWVAKDFTQGYAIDASQPILP